MTKQLQPNTNELKIKTDIGFVPFEGVAQMGMKRVYEITFDDASTITASATHFFFTLDERPIAVAELIEGTKLLGIETRTVVSVEYVEEVMTYDVINTETHTYYANGVLSHNCEFISSDPLLIDTLVLANMKEAAKDQKPIGQAGDIIFYKHPLPGMTYLIGGDLATGTGEDYTVFVAYDFPSLDQVAEFRSNSTSSVVSYHMLKKMIRIFEKTSSSVYFTVENNGVGEGVIALFEADENPPATAEFVSESGQKRKGMTTTGKSKMKACLALKEIVERAGINIRSMTTINELESFVRSAGSYAAKRGSTDDSIMATIQVIRMLSEIAKYDDRAYDKLFSGAYYSDADNGPSQSDDTIRGISRTTDTDEGFGSFI